MLSLGDGEARAPRLGYVLAVRQFDQPRSAALSLHVSCCSVLKAPYPMGYTKPVRMEVEETSTFREWMESLRDVAGKVRILQRIDRLAHGNPGQHRALRDGVKELKIDFGPGYRVYYTECGKTLVVLLAGGDKSTQARDVLSAINLAERLKEGKR